MFQSIVLVSALFCVLAVSFAAGESIRGRALDSQRNNAPGALINPKWDPEYPYCSFSSLVFYSADDVFTFEIEKNQDTAAGILKVEVMDCCVPGDKWAIMIDGQGNKDDTGVGNGSIYEFTGETAVAPFVRGTVAISYAQGVDMFPAGMNVQFCYSREGKNGQPIMVSLL